MKYLLSLLISLAFLASCRKETLNRDAQIRLIPCKVNQFDSIYTFYIPNAFTPNGDDINDYWEPESNGVALDSSEYFINILNKGGEILFSSNKPAKYYGQGKNGKILAEQALCFYIEARNKLSGEKHSYTGSFVLYR